MAKKTYETYFLTKYSNFTPKITVKEKKIYNFFRFFPLLIFPKHYKNYPIFQNYPISDNYPEFILCRRRIMKTTTVIVFAFVTFILAEPTSALPRRDEGRCPNRVCQNDNFLSCCESYGSYYNKNSCKDDSLRPYLFYCCPNHDYKGCLDIF